MAAKDIYRGIWTAVWGPDSESSFNAMYAMVVNSDGSVNVKDTGTSPPPIGSANFATGQVSVTTSVGGTLIAAARATRTSIVLINDTGTDAVFIGANGVSITTGLDLVAIQGAGAALDITGAIYGIVGTTSQTVSFLEAYN